MVKKNAQMSEVFTIDTDENRCALLFCLQLQHELDDADMLFLTANNFQLVHDNLERVKPYVDYFDTLHAKTKHLFLKDTWLNLNEQYGVHALSKELSFLVEHSAEKLFFLHRVDLFFDKVFDTELEDVMIAFIKDIRYHHKKVIFSYNSKTATGQAFEKLLDKRRDISYHIEEDTSDVDGDCYSTIKTYNKFLKKSHGEICLLSDSADIISMHERIFSNQKDIHFKHCTLENLVNGALTMDETTDVIIYNDSRMDIDEHMLTYLKGLAPFTKIFQLSNQSFLRKTDLGHAQGLGIDYIAPSNFDLLEYVSSIEAVLENDFYSQKVKAHNGFLNASEVDYKTLKDYAFSLKEEDIFYTLLSVNTEDMGIDDVTSLLREEDCFYHDKAQKSMIFILLNILGENAIEVLAKRLKIKKRLITRYHDIAIKED